MHALQISRERKMIWGLRLILLACIIVTAIIYYNFDQTAGSYSKEINLIAVYPKEYTTNEVFTISAHEIGHYIYYKKLTEKQRQEYEKIFNSSNEYISEYSKTNAAENFAEEFALTTRTYVYINSVSPSRKEFFKSIYDDNVGILNGK